MDNKIFSGFLIATFIFFTALALYKYKIQPLTSSDNINIISSYDNNAGPKDNQINNQNVEVNSANDDKKENKINETDTKEVGMANPASTKCLNDEGKLQIVSDSDGSQFGLCYFDDYSCEEWTYFRGECDIEGDTKEIEQALLNKGLSLTGMQVKIYKHLGKYIEAGVVPVDMLGGGGYVFAVKDGEGVKVLADGNGSIMCNSFKDYPDYSTYLVPECLDDETMTLVKR